MVIGKGDGERRRGAAAVETAMVLIPLTMLLFGVLEYSRLLMDWNVLNNAAREGCRYALANNTNAALATNTQAVVTNYMAGRGASFSNFSVTVSGVHLGVTYQGNQVNNLVAGDMITVTVSGNYTFLNIIPLAPVLPSFPITSSVTMACEGVM